MFLPCINKSDDDDDDDVFNLFWDDFQYKKEIGNNDHAIFFGGGVKWVHYGKCEMVNYYSYDKEQSPKVVKIIHNYTSLTSLILFVFRANFFITVDRTFLSPAYRFAFLGTCFSVTRRSKTITILIYFF